MINLETVKTLRALRLPGMAAELESQLEDPQSYKELTFEDQNKNDKDIKKVNIAYAWSPTLGLMFKYKYFALHFGYQYRFHLKSGVKDYLGTSKFTLGVGVAF